MFVDATLARGVVEALPDGVDWSEADLALLEHDGQIRLRWDSTPVDLFLNTTEFHARAAGRARWEDFGGVQTPFLSCMDLAVFKAFHNRTKDWADLEAMAAADTFDADRVIGVLVRHVGAADGRIRRLQALTS